MLYEIYVVATSMLAQFAETAPYWASGLVLGSLISVYLSAGIADRMSGLSGVGVVGRGASVCVAAVLGVVSPLCMYGTIPVIAALGKKGVPQHLLAAFMISSVLLNPNLFLLGFVLGAHIALARLGLALLAGVLAGAGVLVFRKSPLFSFERFDPKDKGKKRLLPDLLKAFRITAPYLLLGITITALFNRYIPPHWVSAMFGARQGIGVLFAASLSIPLYACGGGIIPLIRAWLFAGMGYGDALAFMIAGPATKITNLAAVKMILGAKNFVLYLAYAIGFAVAVGLIVEIMF